VNEVEAYQVCNSAISALSHGETSLSTFPKLLRRIIDERAWESRRVPGKGIVTMQSLRELVTTPPVTGWGEEPSKIEAVIRDDAEVLAMWREAMKGRAGRPKADDKTRRNPTALKTDDRGRAYDLSRLQRARPDLFAQVAAGALSANAAAIEAGFRRRKGPRERAVAALRALSPKERTEIIASINVAAEKVSDIGTVSPRDKWSQLIGAACDALIEASRLSPEYGIVRALGAVSRELKRRDDE